MPGKNSFLYMFEFVVDDLLITRQNLCAPEEYPTCTEISFRSSVFLSVCDREYGACVNPCGPKCGKCCLFTLESPVTDKDRIQVHVYKKRTESCKFLIGLSDLAAKPIFERVNESFDAENPNWSKALQLHLQKMPKLRSPNKEMPQDDCYCYEPHSGRREQWCPTSELSKRLLPLFNLCNMQTGNIVLIMRLVCNGPAIVSSFPFSRVCSRNPKCPPCPPCGPPCPPPPPCGSEPDPCASCGPCPPSSATGGPMDKKGGRCRGSGCPPGPRPCQMPDPCARSDLDRPKCLRYFACNLDKQCPCDYCEDEFDRQCPTVTCKGRPLSVIEQRLQPCAPCGGIPAWPRYVQDQKKAEAEAVAKGKDLQAEKDKKEAKEAKGKGKDKKRQSGGGFYCENDSPGPSSAYDSWATGGQSCYKPQNSSPCDACCPQYESCCDAARKRALRKLRHLLVKYNIQIE
ncbi:uncharacterized protein [Drosophila pseudoobscura]|uniref:Transcriptional cofactor Bfc domain-containing protein n=1 Tax=Drosophila pseudoobscura pseudoobscura TaxID=46245 RepID=Q29EV2_DROPS|nr:uncharacterized protein LOC4812272 [Drosophila pseudoobscura]